MATTVTYNGVLYTLPQRGDPNWDAPLNNFLRALADGRRYTLESYGAVAVNGYAADALGAFNRAKADAVANGGGVIEGAPGVLYDLELDSDGNCFYLGVPFVDVADIRPDRSFADAPSFNLTKFNLARAAPPVSFEGNGCIIRGNFSSGSAKPIFSVFISDSHAKPNQDKFHVTGVTIVGKEGYTGSPPAPNFSGSRGALSASNHQVGYFSVLSSARLEDVQVRECDRGIVLSDCYSSLRTNITVSHCNRNFELYADNGAVSINLKSLLCENEGLTLTGQETTVLGYTTEQCKVDLAIPSCDGASVLGCYLENTTVGDTGFGVILGDSSNPAASQVIKLNLQGAHFDRTYGSSIFFHSVVYASIRDFRSYPTGAVVNNAGCSIKVDGYPMDFTASAFATSAVTQIAAGAPNGVIQVGGASGSKGITTAQGVRYYPDSTVYIAGDGSGRVVVTGGGYYSSNLEVAGSSYLNAVNGPGSTTAHLFQNNVTDGASALGFDFSASANLANAAALIARWRTAGNTRMSLFGLGDLELHAAGKGLILKSPDGTKRVRIAVDNAGAVTATII